ncbi:MAG TPA: hypothetical protein VGD13_01985, partial [Xanthobacteraceae bacterium]
MTSAMVIVAVAAVTSAFAQGNKYTAGPKVSNGQVRGAGGGQRGAGGQRGGGNVARGDGGRGRGSGGGGAVAAGVALGVIGVMALRPRRNAITGRGQDITMVRQASRAITT